MHYTLSFTSPSQLFLPFLSLSLSLSLSISSFPSYIPPSHVTLPSSLHPLLLPFSLSLPDSLSQHLVARLSHTRFATPCTMPLSNVLSSHLTTSVICHSLYFFGDVFNFKSLV